MNIASSSPISALRLGALQLGYRVVRTGAPDGVGVSHDGGPDPSLPDFFAARTTPGGLVICRTAPVLWRSRLRPGLPAIESAPQVNAWRDVTAAIHAAGGLAMAQLGDDGACPADQLDLNGLDAALQAYRRAAENASDAGFDGVELLCSDDTLRWQLGGEAVAVDAAAAVVSYWPASRVGICLPLPSAEAGRVEARTLLRSLRPLALAYLHLWAGEPRADASLSSMASALRRAFRGPLLLSAWQDAADAAAALDQLPVDAVGVVER
jgi:2,4-dienoyl-CoA reductase-like NADH-dependent reductase (Old Yellow Enzyme family)